MTDIHASIRAFVQHQTVMSLSGKEDGAHFTKAGLVPFITAPKPLFYVMRPPTKRPELGSPPLQLCKGTRQYYHQGAWQDMRDGWEEQGQKEELLETALREGIEELGLVMKNIKQLYDLGAYAFSSASSGSKKRMWLFAAEVKSATDFLPDADIAAVTAARAWLPEPEFAVVGREDQRYILSDIARKLSGAVPFAL